MTPTTNLEHIPLADCRRVMRNGASGQRALAVPTTGPKAMREAIIASTANLCPESEVTALLRWLDTERLDLTPVATIGQPVAKITGHPVRGIEADPAAAEWEVVAGNAESRADDPVPIPVGAGSSHVPSRDSPVTTPTAHGAAASILRRRRAGVVAGLAPGRTCVR